MRRPLLQASFCFDVNQKELEWHGAMDKALACHAIGSDSNPVTTKDFSAPIILGTPSLSLSLSQWLGVTLETGDLLRGR